VAETGAAVGGLVHVAIAFEVLPQDLVPAALELCAEAVVGPCLPGGRPGVPDADPDAAALPRREGVGDVALAAEDLGVVVRSAPDHVDVPGFEPVEPLDGVLTILTASARTRGSCGDSDRESELVGAARRTSWQSFARWSVMEFE
jgi:hypothetical protein